VRQTHVVRLASFAECHVVRLASFAECRPGGHMRRRGMTVLVGAVLVTVLTILVGQARVPYVELGPGPTYDTVGLDEDGKEVIVVTGATTSKSEGQLRFVTVAVQSRVSLIEAIVGWWNDEDAVVPRELIFPPGQTQEEVEQQNAEDFANSQSAAQAAALAELGYRTTIKVKAVAPDKPAAAVLKAGDVITSVDGATIDSGAKLVEQIRAKPAGSELSVGILRAGKAEVVKVKTYADDTGVQRIGIDPEVSSSAPFTLSIPVENVGGPSAGLMLALGIIDKLKPEDLTGGKIIAGTGTIDPAGAVGPIGGVPQKLVGAKEAGATYFLTPKDNCSEAVANAQPGLTLVQVATLDEALAALGQIRAGQQPALCPGAR
jgi:PDZ domain-containing protein